MRFTFLSTHKQFVQAFQTEFRLFFVDKQGIEKTTVFPSMASRPVLFYLYHQRIFIAVCRDRPFKYLDKIKNAGSVFMGKYCPEALGDYFSGPNHTLPTSGTARFSSPLSVDDFVKKTQFSYYTEDALARVARKVEFFANKEGLGAHAKSAVIRIEDKD